MLSDDKRSDSFWCLCTNSLRDLLLHQRQKCRGSEYTEVNQRDEVKKQIATQRMTCNQRTVYVDESATLALHLFIRNATEQKCEGLDLN